MSPIQFATLLLETGLYLLKYDKGTSYFIAGYANNPNRKPTFFLSGMVDGKTVYDMHPIVDLLTLENETGIHIWEWDLTLSVRGIRA